MAFAKKAEEIAVIKKANMVQLVLPIRGTAPLVMHKFSKKVKTSLLETQTQTKAERKTKAQREARNVEQEFLEAQHISVAGWVGIPCTAFRCAMIDACRTVGLVMTKAKMSVFIEADGFDTEEGTPLVELHSPQKPELTKMPVRLESGVASIAIRPMWRDWSADVKIKFDADMITPSSVVNLLDRAGKQVGILEGRPYSKNSVGQGWGTFEIDEIRLAQLNKESNINLDE
jgi:hypothetical protein